MILFSIYRHVDDDVHIDIDSLDDPENESVREALWEENSTTSSPAESTVSTSSSKSFDVVIKWKTQHTTPSEHFQNPTEKLYKEARLIPVTYKYMTAHFPGLVQALQ